jgi:hypothetical protein
MPSVPTLDPKPRDGLSIADNDSIYVDGKSFTI